MQNGSNKKRLIWIDLLRLIGIIGVIFMHVVGNTINTFGGLNTNANIFYTCVAFLFEFTMPMFMMLSGMMFLGKEKISYKEMFSKYCLKIIVTIFLIGFIMVAMEEVFTNKTFTIDMFGLIFRRILSGDIWAHMWYLYTLLGLYLITPALVLITNRIEQKEYKYSLIVLFMLTVFINTLNSLFDLNIAFNMLGISAYIFYYFYGYYLYKYEISNQFKIINYILAILSIGYTVYFVINNTSLDLMYSYTTFIPFIMASSAILALKDKEIHSRFNGLISSIGICGYGIYVYHQLFINIIYKLLKIDLIVNYPYIGLIGYTLVILCCSYVFTYIIKKIPKISNFIA